MSAVGVQALTELLYNGPELNYVAVAALLAVLAASLALVLLQNKRQQAHARKQKEAELAAASSGGSPRRLRRKMSNIGLSTLMSETETNLSIPVSLLSVDGKITAEEFIARLQERISSDPFFIRFRSLVVGHERTFVELPEYDISRNVQTHTLRENETPISYVETLVNAPLDFAKPLWEMHVIVDPTNDQVTHFAWKVHHCIGDGASLSTAMIRLSDNKDQFDAMIEKMQAAKKSEKKPRKTRMAKLKEFGAFLLLCAWSQYVILRKLGVLIFRSEPATIFKRRGGKTKKLSYNMLYSVATTKQIGKKYGATVNDVMLHCVAGAMRKALIASGTSVAPSLTVRAAIPVDMRGTNEVVKSSRNKFSALVIDFPVGVIDPEKRLAMIKTNMNEAKNSLEKFFTYTSSHVVAQLPSWLMKHVIAFTTSRISVAISNVRAASFSIGMCGKPLKGFYGFVPPPPSVNLGIAILSVGDELGLNVLVDPSIGVDAKEFLRYAKEEFDALRALVEQPPAAAAATTDEEKKEQ